jgi:transcriptional regulator with XRE-family HTH domain
MTDADSLEGAVPTVQATPWAELLRSSKLKASGLNIESLAAQVGVSAAYLRLLRQGKRSASAETASRLFTQLGLNVQTKPKDGGAEVIADDGEGNVVVVSAKAAKGGRPSSLEQTLEEILQTTRDLQERVSPVYVTALQAESEELPRLHEWLAKQRGSLAGAFGSVAAREMASVEAEEQPARRLSNPWKSRSGSAVPLADSGLVYLGMATESDWSPKREEAESLLQEVSEDDLPLAISYLALLAARHSSSPQRSGRRSSGQAARGDDQT